MLTQVSCNATNENTPTTPEQSRHIKLNGQSNFRDLGGYSTKDGRTVKWKQIYRSGELHKLTGEDVQILANLQIKTVASFLTQDEIKARGHDKLPDITTEIALPIETGGGLVEVTNTARNTGDFSSISPDLNPHIHQLLVTEAAEQYAQVLRQVAEPNNRPMVIHCSHGVHRTGTASAILLWALGVPWQTIRHDYMLSNTYRAEEINLRLQQLTQLAANNQNISPGEVDQTNMRAFYVLQEKYIDATRDAILNKYGSIDNYLINELGISQNEINYLRNQLLE